MLFDDQLTVAVDQQVLNTPAGITLSSIPLRRAREMGSGESLTMHFTVTEPFVSNGSVQTITFQVIVSPLEGLFPLQVMGQTFAVPNAQLTLGAQFHARLNPLQGVAGAIVGLGDQLFLGAGWSCFPNTQFYTAGRFTARMLLNPDTGPKIYPAGYVV